MLVCVRMSPMQLMNEMAGMEPAGTVSRSYKLLHACLNSDLPKESVKS